MDIEEVKQLWRREAAAETHVALDAGRVSGWIEARVRDVNRGVRRRLRREAAIYIPMLLALTVMMLLQGITGTRLLLVAGLNLAVGAIVATLWYSDRQLRTLPLDRSVRQVLADLRIRVDRAGRAYAMSYVSFVACAMGAVGVTAWWQTGSRAWVTMAIGIGALAVLWARRSGRAYVDRMFGPSRSELDDCLRDLGDEEATT